MTATKKASKAASTPTQPKPKIVWKGNREYEHHLFFLKLSECKKNVSWRYGDPKIENIQHVHHYHSKNRKGKDQATCQPIAGHFHEVTMYLDDDGSIKGECGPPLKKHDKKMLNGKYKKVNAAVTYQTADPEVKITDTHTHEVEYVHSEVLSANRVLEKQRQDAARFKAMQPEGAQFTPAPVKEPLPEGSSVVEA